MVFCIWNLIHIFLEFLTRICCHTFCRWLQFFFAVWLIIYIWHSLLNYYQIILFIFNYKFLWSIYSRRLMLFLFLSRFHHFKWLTTLVNYTTKTSHLWKKSGNIWGLLAKKIPLVFPKHLWYHCWVKGFYHTDYLNPLYLKTTKIVLSAKYFFPGLKRFWKVQVWKTKLNHTIC